MGPDNLFKMRCKLRKYRQIGWGDLICRYLLVYMLTSSPNLMCENVWKNPDLKKKPSAQFPFNHRCLC